MEPVMNRYLMSIVLVAATAACSQTGSQDPAGGKPQASATAQAQAPALAPAGESKPQGDMPDVIPTEKYSDGAKAFAAVKQAMLSGYYDKGLTEDDLYRAATKGMLEHVDANNAKWNKLLSPGEVAAIKNDLKGEIVGVGVEIKFDDATGYTDVLGIIPGSPAEKAGILPGDTIVTVNSKLYKGKTIHEVVADIRGKVGETLTLSILRADKLITVPLVRQVVTFDSVSHFELPGSVGYLRIRAFSTKTPAMLKAALDDFAQKNEKALVVDVRENGGGAFDDAVASAELFLPSGAPIATIAKRDGEEKFASKGSPVLAGVPIAVLVDHNTASSAELVAAALSEGRHATIIGARTYGKWSVQQLDDLPNGYAFKYTSGIFKSPSGKSYGGVGLTPDIEIAMDEKAFAKVWGINDATKRLAADPPLRTALTILQSSK
jgi:carboxyl-terminal processing protease